jgi:hypothetical protein
VLAKDDVCPACHAEGVMVDSITPHLKAQHAIKAYLRQVAAATLSASAMGEDDADADGNTSSIEKAAVEPDMEMVSSSDDDAATNPDVDTDNADAAGDASDATDDEDVAGAAKPKSKYELSEKSWSEALSAEAKRIKSGKKRAKTQSVATVGASGKQPLASSKAKAKATKSAAQGAKKVAQSGAAKQVEGSAGGIEVASAVGPKGKQLVVCEFEKGAKALAGGCPVGDTHHLVAVSNLEALLEALVEVLLEVNEASQVALLGMHSNLHCEMIVRGIARGIARGIVRGIARSKALLCPYQSL